ncbi:peptidoglycan bridge formation glycyltransferase FemA/FemB family protein [Streptococcus halichoeri]|uniref:peptidoglycan bridge formation glycyltransferase FemA/FemB family protein n=1 Tax=Streptococcus halichoeri TaxID=254785 RepID=UPI00135ADA29|nr:peptidoglycan bridge formation glycyltransferase FemA/FemB family protein [Streptococcus halichoeri]
MEQYSCKIGISEAEHDSFVTGHAQINLLQSSRWAKVKDNWENERIGIYQAGVQVASMSLLIKRLPLGYSLIYIPRGPVMDYSNACLVHKTLSYLKAYGKAQKALFIKCDPAVLYRQFRIGQEAQIAKEGEQAINHLLAAGAKWAGLTSRMAESIQPRFQANKYLLPDREIPFPKHTKRLMADAKKRGVQTIRGSIDQLDAFCELIAKTKTRKQISLRNRDYFARLMTVYGEDAFLHFAKIDIDAQLELFREHLSQVKQALAQTPQHQKRRLQMLNDQKRSLDKYIEEFEHYQENESADNPAVAGILSVAYGDVMEMLYAGMDDRFKKCYPQYLLYPRVFTDASAKQIRWANMGGVEGELNDGLTTFKSHFSPTIEEFIGEFDIPVHPFYPLFYQIYQLGKKWRKRQ